MPLIKPRIDTLIRENERLKKRLSETKTKVVDQFINDQNFQSFIKKPLPDIKVNEILNEIQVGSNLLDHLSMKEFEIIHECIRHIRLNTKCCQEVFNKTPQEMFIAFANIQQTIQHNLKILNCIEQFGVLEAYKRYDPKTIQANKIKEGKLKKANEKQKEVDEAKLQKEASEKIIGSRFNYSSLRDSSEEKKPKEKTPEQFEKDVNKFREEFKNTPLSPESNKD